MLGRITKGSDNHIMLVYLFQELIELADIGRAVFYYRRSVKYTEEYVR